MDQLLIPVSVQKFEKSDKRQKSAPHVRRHVGTVYFPIGTTANEVCVKIQNRDKNTFGLWLLQRKVKDNGSSAPHGQGGNAQHGMDDKDYVTIKDSKYQLEDEEDYVAVHYSGMDIELIL